GSASSHTSSGLGHFFTRDKATAQKYADGGNIYTGWLKIEKPYVMMIEEAQAFDDAQDSAKRRKELQEMGYDGVVILDDDGKPWATVAFEPWQFKSTDNNGAFDEFDDRMRFRNEDQAMRDTSTMRYTGDVPRKDAEDFIRKFVAEYPGAPSIMLADSFDQLPESIRKDAIAQGSGPTRAKGALKSDTAYVVLNNHHSMADLEATIFHEILGHSGVRKMFGPEFSQELNRLFIGLGGYSGLQKIMEQRGLALQFHGYFDAIHQARERNPRAWTEALAQSILTEEVFAHIAEQKNGKKLRDRFMALIGMVRDWMRRYGFASLADLGESDIVFLLQKAREGLREGDGVLREGTHVGEKEIVDADGRPVARESSPDYEAIKTISGRLGLREREAPTVFANKADAGYRSNMDDENSVAGNQAPTPAGDVEQGGENNALWRQYLESMGLREDGKKIFHKYGMEMIRSRIEEDFNIAIPKLKAKERRKSSALRKVLDGTKILDSDGAPLLLYHGTDRDFDEFDVSSSGGIDIGVWLTDDYEYADWIAKGPNTKGSKEGANIRAVFLKSKKPFVFDILKEGIKEAKKTKVPPPETPMEAQSLLSGAEGWDNVVAQISASAKSKGYDSLVLKNFNDRFMTGVVTTAYIAFSPDQIVDSRNLNESSASAGSDAPAVLRTEFSAPEFRQKARDAVANLTDGLRGETARSLNWWDRTVGTQNGKAKKDADFGRVYHHAHAFIDGVSDFANRAADKARGILPHLDSWRDIGSGLNIRKQWTDSKDYQAIAKAIFDGTLVNGTSGKVWSDKELKKKYGLNEKQIGLYREFRAAVDFSLETLAASEMSRLARASKLEVADRDMVMDDAKDFYIKQIKERLKEARAAIDSNAGAVVARHMEERAAVEDAFDDFASEESKEIIRKEMERRHKTEIDEVMKAVNDLEALRDSFIDKADKIHELQEQGYAPLMRFGEYTVDVVRLDKDGNPVMDEDGNPDRPFFGMFESEAEARKAEKVLAEEYPEYTVTRGVLSVEASQLYRGLTPETAELFARMLGTDTDDAFQAYLKQAVANRSAMKRLIHRMGMEGFSNDVPRVLASFITSNARLSSGNWHFGDMSKAVEAIPKHKGDIKDEAIRLMQYVQNPQEEAAGLRGFLFFNFLGGSIASALVNLTQTFTTTLPYLNQFGPASVAKALPKAMTLAGKMMTKRGIDSVEDRALREALKRAQDEGVVDPQEIHLLMAESQGNGASSSVSSLLGMVNKEWATPAARVTRAATQAWGSLFGAAEKYNRHVAFIAAWEVAPEGVDRYEFAKNAVTETQFDYTKASRPNWGRGAIGATLFTFKTFTISYLEFLSRLPPRERALAIAVLFLFAGMSGMPGADDLDDVIDTIGQKMGYNWNNAGSRHAWIVKTLGHDGANFVEHGISSMLPLDVSSRLGVGNIVPGTGALKKSNQNASRDVQEFFGPAGSMVAAGRDVFDAAGSGKGAVDVALPILPKMFRDLRQAVDMWETGSYNDMKGRKVVDVSKVDALIKGIGFQPNAVAEPRRVERMLAQSSGMQRAIRDDIHELMARGRVEGDAEKQEAARELMRSWNEKNPDAPIRLNPASLAQRTRAMRLTSADRLVKATPKEMRGAIAAELETQR
ncbi:MAG: PLxRFG domain-containing protein, partial [Afipia sp.]